MKNLLIICSILIFGGLICVNAQISSGGEPESFSNSTNLRRISTLPIVETPSFDKNRMVQEDLSGEQMIRPLRFAKGFKVDYDFMKTALVEKLANGDKLYRLAVKSKGATAVNVHFDKFVLPIGGKLHIYSKDKKHVIGAFTQRNNKDSEMLPTGFVLGEEIIIEYLEPVNATSETKLHIGRIGHDYQNIQGFFSVSGVNYGWHNRSLPCEIDVNCSQGNDAQDIKRAVAGMTYIDDDSGNYYVCSGSLINNTLEDGTPYFLTASHCVNSSPEAQSCIFYFNYERHVCNGLEGTLAQCVAASELVANNDDTDFSLLELDMMPPENYNVHYAGWNRGAVAATSSKGIHHPKGDVKKIAIENNSATSYTEFAWYENQVQVSPTYPANSHWRVEYDEGLTEGGSSGSSLFNQSNQIVGQLNGGLVNCAGNFAWSVYGKLANSWTGGGTPETRLKDWLDPNNSGVLSMSGKDALQCTYELSIDNVYNNGDDVEELASYKIVADNEINSGARVVYNAGNLIELNPGFVAEPNAVFCGLIEGCQGDLLSMFPVYEDIIYSDNCCDDVMVVHYLFEAGNPDDNIHYVYIENGPNCSPFSATYANGLYFGPNIMFNLDEGVTYHYNNMTPDCSVDIFEVYPWINNHLDANNCCAGTKVTAYTGTSWFSNGSEYIGSDYIYIEYGQDCGNKSELYYASNGVIACTDNPNDCIEEWINFYWLLPDEYPGYVLYEASCKTDNTFELSENEFDGINSARIYPNPISSNTNIDFDLKTDENVSIDLFDIQGKLIKSILPLEKRLAGSHRENIDCSDIVAGTYFCNIKMGETIVNEKVVVLK